MEYVLYIYNEGINGYYQGRTWTHQGEVFPCTTAAIRDAKKYTSLARAENAIECLSKKISHKVEHKMYFRAASNNKFEPTGE